MFIVQVAANLQLHHILSVSYITSHLGLNTDSGVLYHMTDVVTRHIDAMKPLRWGAISLPLCLTHLVEIICHR